MFPFSSMRTVVWKAVRAPAPDGRDAAVGSDCPVRPKTVTATPTSATSATTAPYMRRRRRARCLASLISASASASGSSFWNSRGSFGRGGALTVTDTSLILWR